MRCSIAISAILAASPVVSALPFGGLNWLESIARRGSDIFKTGMAQCDPSRAQLPSAPTALPAISQGLVLGHVALGRGTQNYTCDTTNPSSAPKAAGAVATLFNMTCTASYSGNLLHWLPRVALSLPIPTSSRAADKVDVLMSGHHDFLNLTTAHFNLATNNHDFGSVASQKIAAVDAPQDAARGFNGLGSVPWLKLKSIDYPGIEGRYKEVYRVDTAGGVAPKTCDGQQANFQVQYAANYYFYM